MSARVATRSVLLELRDERSSMREGFTFLDEKCLVLAGALLAELNRYQALWGELAALVRDADEALSAALGRHGLEGLAIYPLLQDAGEPRWVFHSERRSVMGVALLDAACKITPPMAAEPLLRTPEADACASAHAKLLCKATELAASAGNLERLQHEYRRTSRRARALDGVLLPELDREVEEMAVLFEEQEREEAILMRPRGR